MCCVDRCVVFALSLLSSFVEALRLVLAAEENQQALLSKALLCEGFAGQWSRLCNTPRTTHNTQACLHAAAAQPSFRTPYTHLLYLYFQVGSPTGLLLLLLAFLLRERPLLLLMQQALGKLVPPTLPCLPWVACVCLRSCSFEACEVCGCRVRLVCCGSHT